MGGPVVRVRSSAVRIRDQFVLARYGKLSRDLYRGAASAELGRVLATPGDVWVDFGLFIEATALVCSMFEDGTPKLAREVGAYGAEANMGPWRSLAHRLLSPKLLFEMAGMLWSHHYDGGRLSTSSPADRVVVVRLDEFPQPHALHCASIEGWMDRTLRYGKPTRLSVTHTACRTRGDATCEFRAEWETGTGSSTDRR